MRENNSNLLSWSYNLLFVVASLALVTLFRAYGCIAIFVALHLLSHRLKILPQISAAPSKLLINCQMVVPILVFIVGMFIVSQSFESNYLQAFSELAYKRMPVDSISLALNGQLVDYANDIMQLGKYGSFPEVQSYLSLFPAFHLSTICALIWFSIALPFVIGAGKLSDETHDRNGPLFRGHPWAFAGIMLALLLALNSDFLAIPRSVRGFMVPYLTPHLELFVLLWLGKFFA